MKRKLLAAILAGLMILSLLPTSFSSVAMAAGTPTPISDRAGLAAISGSGSYRLTADIDLSGEDWTPLPEFSGTLDGGDHIIMNLSITDTTGAGKGLFASIADIGEVCNLGMEDVSITAGNNAGAIAGTNNGTIRRCYATGTVSGKENAGGLVGANGSVAVIENCYSRVSVSGNNYLGGIAGSNSGSIAKCYAASSVTDSVMNNYLQFNAASSSPAAASYDSGGYVEIPHIDTYNNISAFTLEAWFQWDDVGTANTEFIIGKGYERFEIHTGGGSGENGLRFIPIPHGANSSFPSIGGYQGDSWIDVHNVLQTGWFHVAAVYSYSDSEHTASVQVYVNGEAQDLWQLPSSGGDAENRGKTATLVRSENPLAATNELPFTIGCRTNNSLYFKGKIADVRFWNTARTGEQIKANKDKVLDGTEAGLVGYWKLMEDTGPAIDSTTGGSNGTLQDVAPGSVERVVSAGTAANKGALAGSNTGSVISCFYDSTLFGSDPGGEGTAASTADMKRQTTYADWEFGTTWRMESGAYPNLGFKTVTSVTVTPATISVVTGESHGFSASVAGANDPDETVTWSVEGNTSSGTAIGTDGVLTVGSGETATTLTVRATSAADTAKSGAAAVTVVPLVAFDALAARDGSDDASTTALTLLFDKDIDGFSEDDITITGATKGTLTKESGTGVYKLTISAITVADKGNVNVALHKNGFSFTPANMSVQVRKYTPAYAVTYSANGGSGTMTQGTATEGIAFTLPACGFTPPTGMHFKEWAIGSTSGAKAAAGSDHTFTSAATVYAVWEANRYTVSYYDNKPSGASGSVSGMPYAASHDYGAEFNLGAAPALVGYTFGGWYRDIACTEVNGVGDAGASVSNLATGEGADVPLYAKWTANTDIAYTVVHYVMDTEGNWPVTATKTENLSGTSDAELTLSDLKDATLEVANGITYSHGEVEGSAVPRTTILPDGSRVIKLYYTRARYQLTLVKGTGIDRVGESRRNYYGQPIMINAAVIRGYTWDKWTSSDTALLVNGTTPVYAFNMPAGDVTLTASATLSQYSVSYAASQRGSILKTSTNYKSGFSDVIIPDAGYAPPRSITMTMGGSAFTDFTYYSSAGAIVISENTVFGNIVITGSCTLKEYRVTYATDGGSAIEAGSYDIEDTVFTLPTAPEKTGYTFSGWKVTGAAKSGTGFALNDTFRETTRALSRSYGNVTLTAQWTTETYTVNYNTDGGSAISAGSYDIEDTDFTLPTPPEKAGCTFSGWKVTGAAAGGTGFAPDTSFGSDTTSVTLSGSYGSVTLTAQWTADTYILTYNANGGTGTMASGTATYGTAFPLPDCGFTAPAGKQFKEWAIGSATGSKVAAGGTYSFTEVTTVYAVWESIPVDPVPVEYRITQGQDGQWNRDGNLGFTANGDYSMFTGVMVDGTALSSDDYTSASGSTIVTLKAAYLETLSVGQHTLRISFTDGYAETRFTIQAAPNPDAPPTGDSSQPLLWLGIAILSITGLVVCLALGRKKRQNSLSHCKGKEEPQKKK